MKKMMMLTTAVMLAGSALATAATVGDVFVRQRWPWSKKVDISFVLGASDKYQDVTLTAYNGTIKLGAIPAAALTGETEGLSKNGGRFTLVFDPAKSGFSTDVIKDFRVEVTTADSTYVLYKIINLVAGNVTDVTIADLKEGKYGAWQENPVEGVSSVIWTGVTNVNTWATTNLVLRHVKAGSFYMNYNAKSGVAAPSESQHVTLSRDFYIGVFEITQKQFELIYGSNPSFYTNQLYAATRPVDKVQYVTIRGTDSAADWPNNTAVAAGSFCSKLSLLAGGLAFDLPTDAQWEYAGRAGTQTELNIGVDSTAAACATVGPHGKVISDQNADLGYGTSTVGMYLPNAWGLYDIHGNVEELCRDGSAGDNVIPVSVNTPVTTDPTGAIGAWEPTYKKYGTYSRMRVVRGDIFLYGTACTMKNRGDTASLNTAMYVGFRVMMQP